MTEKTTLVDCMEEHGVEREGYNTSIVFCPYQEIAEKLLKALKVLRMQCGSIPVAVGSRKWWEALHEAQTAITQAEVYE